MRKAVSFLALLLALASCEEHAIKKPEKDVLSGKFDNYLRSSFDDSIPARQHLFVIIPNVNCELCREQTGTVLKDRLEDYPQQNWTVIVSANLHIPDSIFPKENRKKDWDDVISSIGLPLNGITFIRTEAGIISRINSIETLGSRPLSELMN